LKYKYLTESLKRSLSDELFPADYQLIPNINDLYELELAFQEKQILTKNEIINNGAYFTSIDKLLTRHFYMCTGESLKLPDYSSSRLKSFFEKNIFRTGYATHGLFPYRGKFHPQMIKGIINIMGLKPGETVLDPMMGSGTVPVEAAIMGIKSIGIDASPFCRFMTQTKIDALTMDLKRSKNSINNYEDVFNYFSKLTNKSVNSDSSIITVKRSDIMSIMEPVAEYVTIQDRSRLSPKDKDTSDTFNFLLLAYLDSVGYSERSDRKSHLEQFKAILERYVFAVGKFQQFSNSNKLELAPAKIMEGDARSLPVEDSSIDGILFSPPYSFAIDYLKNDAFHLDYLGVNSENLKGSMIGLRGKTHKEKYDIYINDMTQVISECSRVLRKGHICTIVVGTNNNQLGKALGVSPEEVMGLHEILAGIAKEHNFDLLKMISRPITGISNTMRLEYILMFQKK
jgi:DNA modification methylase